jgi:hypothetical protein
MARWRVDILRQRAEYRRTVEADSEKEAIEKAAKSDVGRACAGQWSPIGRKPGRRMSATGVADASGRFAQELRQRLSRIGEISGQFPSHQAPQ